MPRQSEFTILKNTPLTDDVFKLELKGNTELCKLPGQFVNILINGCFLRRPISVCDSGDRVLILLCRIVGKGTEALSRMAPGTRLNLLTGLGNGFSVPAHIEAPLIIGGGMGISPLYGLSKRLMRRKRQVTVVLGFRSASNIFYEDEFLKMGCPIYIATQDGSSGHHGLVTDVIKNENISYDYFYACGPEPMLHAVSEECDTSGQLSFEERMGCGFGACAGCTCKTKYGKKRICMDGPVLRKEEIIW